MDKKKSQTNNQKWYFITSLPFDECAHRLSTWRESGIYIEFTAHNDESISFNIEYKMRFKQTLSANGTLQRWEGTHTRVDMNIDLTTNIYSIINFIPFIISMSLIGGGIYFCQFITEISTQFDDVYGLHPQQPNPIPIGVICCIIGVLSLGFIMFWLALPENTHVSTLSKLRFLLRKRLCEGDTSLLQYLIHEGGVKIN